MKHGRKRIKARRQVNGEAAKQFLIEYETILSRLEENPLQFQIDTSFDNQDGYRRAVFSKWYKCLFVIDDTVVYIDSIVDCRQKY